MRCLWLLCLLLAAGATAAGPLRVFVSVLPQQTFVEKVGGDRVEVRVLVGPGQRPATYDPTPRQIAALATADLYVRTGVAFEDAWMARLRAANPDMPILDLRTGLKLRHLEHHDHGTDRPHAGPLLDPHIWTNPRLVRVMAVAIRDQLTRLAPPWAEEFARRQATFDAELQALDAAIRQRLQGLAQPRFMVFHPAWGYFAEAYGLTQLAVEIQGKEPGARTLGTLIDQARREGLRVIFAQPQFDTRIPAEVARALGGRLVLIDPLAADYAPNLLEVAQHMAEAGRP